MFIVKSGNITKAKCTDIESACLLVSTFFPKDGKIYKFNTLVWTEGLDGVASESYDGTAEIVYDRLAKLEQSRKLKNL